MHIKRLVIENFKSIERIELIEPNPFTVFVGPNGSGKSNIFEALEFMNFSVKAGSLVESLFGGKKTFYNRRNIEKHPSIRADLGESIIVLNKHSSEDVYSVAAKYLDKESKNQPQHHKTSHQQFLASFSRLFVRRNNLKKLNFTDNLTLTLSADNLEPVLKRVLNESILRDEIFEWLELFVPGFKAVEVDDRNELHWFEESTPTYFTKDLISDGTYNILALLTAVYQSDDKPQFLCIEEPENGLHPQVARELIDFFRIMCEERGHYIWLNTHSQSMVSRVRPEELIIVEKKEGATQIKQFNKEDFYGMRVDDAWLTNSLGGGLAW